MFDPTLISDPRLNKRNAETSTAVTALPDVSAPIPATPAPVAQDPAPTPVFIPVPVAVPKPTGKKAMMVTANTARKAQSIYPAEAQAKQSLIENAKAPPTPTGAWGSSK